MSGERLSALDAGFLAVERPGTPMHVGWVATFDAPEDGGRPEFAALRAHIAERMAGAPRFRQRLAGVPLGLHDPVWVDDPAFDAASHLRHAPGPDLDAVVDAILSSPLARDRPLWEMWIADELADGRVGLIGKAHHCMVDGAAVVELGNVLLDREPETALRTAGDDWSPAPVPSAGERLGRAALDRTADAAALALAPVRLAGSPGRLRRLPDGVRRGARVLSHTVLPPAPGSFLNRRGSAARRHVRITRPLDDVRAIRRRFGVTPNDVVLAACAGALRRLAERRGEPPRRLKAMVPADVRSSEDDAGSGNRIAFLFIPLPCDEPDPVARLRAVRAATEQRRRDGEAETVDAAFQALARTPGPVQRVLAEAFAHPRLFNLTVSSIAGPAVPRHLYGCRLRTVHSAVPLAGRHALSLSVVTAAGNACFAVYADAEALPEADALAADLEAALDELLSAGP